MAAIAASGVSYSILSQRSLGNRILKLVSMTFGNATDTYPSGGIPLTASKMGGPNSLESVNFTDAANANGYLYKWDRANNKLRIYQGDNTNASAAPNIEVTTGHAPASTVVIAEIVGW